MLRAGSSAALMAEFWGVRGGILRVFRDPIDPVPVYALCMGNGAVPVWFVRSVRRVPATAESRSHHHRAHWTTGVGSSFRFAKWASIRSARCVT